MTVLSVCLVLSVGRQTEEYDQELAELFRRNEQGLADCRADMAAAKAELGVGPIGADERAIVDLTTGRGTGGGGRGGGGGGGAATAQAGAADILVLDGS
eukprot:SAG22_NODE_1538_length_4178_cov_4.649179_2_plen_99_part_00